MKKLLLCTLSLFAFVGLTACGSETKLTAEEAQTELKEIREDYIKIGRDFIILKEDYNKLKEEYFEIKNICSASTTSKTEKKKSSRNTKKKRSLRKDKEEKDDIMVKRVCTPKKSRFSCQIIKSNRNLLNDELNNNIIISNGRKNEMDEKISTDI